MEDRDVDGRVINVLKLIEYKVCECGVDSSGLVDT